MITGPFKVSKAFSEGWKLTKKHWLVMIGLLLGYIILTLLLDLFMGVDKESVRYWVFQVVAFIISMIFSVGYYKMYLVAADGEEPEFDLFSKGIKKVFPFFILSVLFGIGTVVGLCLLIVPGLWFMVRFGFAPLILIDKEDCGVIDAFKQSYALTAGHAWPILGMYGLFIVTYIVGLIALIIGVFVSTVITYFTFVAAYRMLENTQEEVIAIKE